MKPAWAAWIDNAGDSSHSGGEGSPADPPFSGGEVRPILMARAARQVRLSSSRVEDLHQDLWKT